MFKAPNRNQKRNNVGGARRNGCHFPQNHSNLQKKEENGRTRENKPKREENRTVMWGRGE
jgi:hypothetical protein